MKWILILLMVGTASAADLNIGLMTKHVGGSGYNENNHLVGLSIGKYEIGTFNNSYDVRSHYVARRFEYNDRLGVMVGGVSGYDFHDGLIWGAEGANIIPMVGVYFRLNNYLTVNQMANAFMLTLNLRGII